MPCNMSLAMLQVKCVMISCIMQFMCASQPCPVQFFEHCWMQDWEEVNTWDCNFRYIGSCSKRMKRSNRRYNADLWSWITRHWICLTGVYLDFSSLCLCHRRVQWELQSLCGQPREQSKGPNTLQVDTIESMFTWSFIWFVKCLITKISS